MATVDTIDHITSFHNRSAGTDAERRAANWLAAELKKTGRIVKVQTFWCRPNWALAHAWHVALALIASLVSIGAARVGVALLAVALLSVIADHLTGHSPGRRLTPEHASQNVTARSGQTDPTTRLILTANYDAGRAGLIYHRSPRAAAAALRRVAGPLALGWLAWLCLAVVWLMVVAALRAAGHGGTATDIIQLPPSVALVLGLALLLETAASPPGPAANDNASGTAVALALARALDIAPPRHIAVDVVLQGAGVGFRRYDAKRGDTVVIGLGPSGAGSVRWWRSDGPLFPLRYSPRLDELSAIVAADHQHLNAAAQRTRGTTPALAARLRRLPAITIGCLDAQGLAPHSHQATDHPDQVDAAALDRTTQFALILVDAVDAFFAERAAGRETVATPA